MSSNSDKLYSISWEPYLLYIIAAFLHSYGKSIAKLIKAQARYYTIITTTINAYYYAYSVSLIK